MGEKGVTLIEMLLVVAILGFLVAILLPSVSGVSTDAKVKFVKADLRQLKTAIVVYYTFFGSYPPADATWGQNNSPLLTANGTAGYSRLIDQFPVDPYGNGTAKYGYGLHLSGTYAIWSVKKANPGALWTDPVLSTDGLDTKNTELYVTNARVITN